MKPPEGHDSNSFYFLPPWESCSTGQHLCTLFCFHQSLLISTHDTYLHTFHSLIAQSSVFLWMFDEEIVFVIPWQCPLSLHWSLSLPEVACAIVGLMWRGHLPAPLNKMGNETSTSELPVRRFQLGPAAWLSTAVFVSSETLRLPCLCVP